MEAIKGKIEADDRTVRDVLDKKKYTVDYFQREYKWEMKHIEQLIFDLEASFSSNYKKNHERKDVANYNCYYLGPIVISAKDGKRSIIDGQQRLTSITLLLIYLNNLQKNHDGKVSIDSLIFSEYYGTKSFNMHVPERYKYFKDLYEGKEVKIAKLDESGKNIIERYRDLEELFPDELKGNALPYFLDWLADNVVFVEIKAYSDENAYTIFETMNDRGLSLTYTEMLKGFLLSKIKDTEKRDKVNVFWRKRMAELNEYWKDADLEFFKAWFRSKYAETIRPGKKGAANEDFEKIGTRYHTWVKDNVNNLA